MLKNLSPLRLFILIISMSLGMMSVAESSVEKKGERVKKILVVGDSMAGWLGERLNAYGMENGFEAGTVVWDGATIQKYADSSGFKRVVDAQDPDVVFVCLGLNNLAEPAPERIKPDIDKIRKAVGDRELVWVGPPSWPGKPNWTALNTWLEKEIGKDRYFNSFPLTLPRQSKTNPHPTKEGISEWGDAIVKWIGSTDLNFPEMKRPVSTPFARGKYFLYKKMKDNL